jgi:hypothetical protein
MRRAVAVLIGLELVAALPASAQNADPFRSAAPPTAAPGPDPFRSSPEQQAVTPPPAPKPRPAPVPEPRPEAIVVAPPPPASPPPPPAPKYDGVYSGDVGMALDSASNCKFGVGPVNTFTVRNSFLTYHNESNLITGTINDDGTVKAYTANRGAMLSGQFRGAEFIGDAIFKSCHLQMHMQKQR